MKTQISSIILGILLIGIISAVDFSLTANEQTNITLSESYSYYSIIGNTSEINIEVSQNGNVVSIIPDKYSQDSEFTIVFFNKEKEIITQYSGGGSGGSGGIRYVNKTECKNVTKYVDREVIKEKDSDKEIEIQEKIIEKIPFKLKIVIAFLILILLIFVFRIRDLLKELAKNT